MCYNSLCHLSQDRNWFFCKCVASLGYLQSWSIPSWIFQSNTLNPSQSPLFSVVFFFVEPEFIFSVVSRNVSTSATFTTCASHLTPPLVITLGFHKGWDNKIQGLSTVELPNMSHIHYHPPFDTISPIHSLQEYISRVPYNRAPRTFARVPC